MRILSLDLGTHTGWCAGDTAATPEAGTLRLATDAEITRFGRFRETRTGDPRIGRLYDWLTAKVRELRPDAISFEDVEFSSYTKQTQLWASFRTAVWIVAKQASILTECVPVTTLKKWATGTGNATKPMMEAALRRRYPEFEKTLLGFDAVDAIFVWQWTKETLSRK